MKISEIIALLQKGQIISFPTETVMGLGAFFDNEKGYEKLNDVKRRPMDKHYTMMLSDVSQIKDYCQLSHRDWCFISRFMPGPVTVLFYAKDNIPSFVTKGSKVVGVRVPDFDELRTFLRELGKPLLVPSANRSGEPALKKYQDVIDEFKDEVSYVYPKDALGLEPSTIVDLTGDDIKITREGPIKLDLIERSMKQMKIAVGCDHGGYEYKEEIVKYLSSKDYLVDDLGTYSKDSVDYPIYAVKVAKGVGEHQYDYGVVICTSGEGVCITANKVKGVRCGLAYNDEVAKLMRQHNDANVIAFSQKFMTLDEIKNRLDIFLNTQFEGGRHLRRVEEINELDK